MPRELLWKSLTDPLWWILFWRWFTFQPIGWQLFWHIEGFKKCREGTAADCVEILRQSVTAPASGVMCGMHVRYNAGDRTTPLCLP